MSKLKGLIICSSLADVVMMAIMQA